MFNWLLNNNHKTYYINVFSFKNLLNILHPMTNFFQLIWFGIRNLKQMIFLSSTLAERKWWIKI
jgi:hypothetical protein